MNMIMTQKASRLLGIAFLLLLVLPTSASMGAREGGTAPRLPCGGASYPLLPVLDAPPNVAFWNGADFGGTWNAPPCSGWQAASTNIVIALTGHFSNRGDAGAILTRIGMISTLPQVRYWSVTDKKWEALFARATALRGPDTNSPRGDFLVSEFLSGSELYFLSADNRMQTDIMTRIRVKDAADDHVVLEMSNVSPLRFLTFTVVPAGDFQTLYFLDRQPDGSWQFYSVTRVLNGSFLLSRLVTGPSYVNRAVAMYRDIVGIPTDRNPPAMP
jgi:hypothetical protein